jgi:hydrogenase/urease accessory protein HupE
MMVAGGPAGTAGTELPFVEIGIVSASGFEYALGFVLANGMAAESASASFSAG